MAKTINFGKLMKQKGKEIKNDGFLGKDVLTIANKINSSRSIMFNSHLDQFVPLLEPEFPRVFTNYENRVGDMSSSIVTAKQDFRVIKKIKKFDNNYVLVVQFKDGSYDAIQRKELEHLTETYSYMLNNEGLDNLEENQSVKAGTILTKSNSFDDQMNYRYGKNIKCCYLIDNDTTEDAIKMSKSVAESFVSTDLIEVEVSVNSNDVLLHLYGDNKMFPNIGERTKNQILVARRRINNNFALLSLQQEQLRKTNLNDTIFYANGEIVDIDIFANKPLDDSPMNAQIKQYLDNQTRYYTELYETLGEIVNEKNNNAYTQQLSYLFLEAQNYVNHEKVNNKGEYTLKFEDFDNIVINFKVLHKSAVKIGDKFSGRYGNKGVVSKIVPDEEMPMTESGERAGIVFNALGVMNRLNPAQLFEHELNFIARTIQRRMNNMKLNEAKDYFFEFMKDVNKQQYTFLYGFYKKLDKQGKVAFIKDILNNGIYIHQPPFWDNVGIDELAFLYEKYDVQLEKVIWNGYEVEKPFIIADEYILKLKHKASSKFSARSSGFVNSKNMPSKSMAFKKREKLYSSTSIRVGEMEITNLNLCLKPELVSKLIKYYSSCKTGREMLVKKLATTNPLKPLNLPDLKENNNREILDQYMKAMGLELE